MLLSYKRSTRVGKVVYQIVSKVVREIKGLNAIVTVMGVKLTDDLLSAKIYYSVFGSEEDKQKTSKILRKNTKGVRYQLALRLNLRRTPVIHFVYDNTNEIATKVFDILGKIEKER
ncbi:MAG: 30S ribosome-binding factor RbfA [Endomicrobium sp.]|jgi:ribosome-binding factor A|nr:30S ribosome-binding factor RbfA [Endomicrobium sp.]